MKNIITRLTFFVSGFAVGYYTGGEVVRKIYRTIYLDEEKDLIKVVRCKDCKHWQDGNAGLGCYWDADYPQKEDDFCSHGEKSDDV